VKLHLRSKDQHIAQLCREVMAELIGGAGVLDINNDMASECDADLYVWDVEDNFGAISAINPVDKWRHFFIVSRINVQKFRDALAFPDANILLKPVTKATMVAFFSDACNRRGEADQARNDGFIKSLRADRDEILQCLMQANLKLQEYDHDRTNFLARAIHDFRAPLTAITGYCGLLLGEDIGNLTAQQREVLERMHRSARKLSRMASAMFQLSIAPRAEIALDLKHSELRDCIHKSLNEILPAAEEKRISVTMDVDPPTGPLLFEPLKMEQVLINLLENASKFTPRLGAIQIKGYAYFWERRMGGNGGLGSGADRRAGEDKSPNSYRVDICDSGLGIPVAHMDKIFEEYTSYAGGVDRSGGGLGLAICRMIIHQHKGKIWAESSPDGAVFSFVLPCQRQDRVSSVEKNVRAKAAI
jgi:signal transduction histidine kinase